MRHNFKRWILGVVVIAGCAGMMGCSFTKDNSKSGDLNSDAGKRHNNLDYDGSVVDENTLRSLRVWKRLSISPIILTPQTRICRMVCMLG